MIRKVFTAMALTALAALPVRADVYSIDKAHSEVSFQVRHLLTNVRGRFNDFAGNVNLDPANLEKSSVDFHIKTASIDTDEPNRDKHLQSPDFFDAANNPEITFKSKTIKKTGKDTYDVTGDFTMHGVTKQLTLPVTFLGTAKDPWGNQRAGFSTELTLNRKDYNINWNKALDNGGALVGDDVKVSINLETVQQKDKPKDTKGK